MQTGSTSFIYFFHKLDDENAFSTKTVRIRSPPYETNSPISIINTIVANDMYGLRKNTSAIEALCHTFSCANAPSCSQMQQFGHFKFVSSR